MDITITFFLWVDLLLNFDYFKPSGTILDIFGTKVGHSFEPLWPIRNGFKSSHNKLGTNLGCFFTFLDGVMVHHRLFGHNFTIFGVKYPCFHGWHPLFILQIPSLLNSLHPLEKKMVVVGQIMAIWPQKPRYDWVFRANLLNFDYFKTS